MGQQNIYPHQNNPGMPSPMGQQNIYPSQNNPGIYLPMSHQNTYPPQNNPGFPSLPQQQVQMGFQAPPVQGEYGIRMPHQNISQMPQQGIYPNSQNAQQGYGAHTNPQNIPNINVRPQMQGNYPNVNNYAQPSGFGANSNVPYPSTNPQYQMPQQEFSGAQSVPKKQIQMEQTPQRAADGSGLAPVMLKRVSSIF